jgi:hypothetical protein
MGGPRMRKKVLGMIIVMLSSLLMLPFTALAGDEENPEITDTVGGFIWEYRYHLHMVLGKIR